MSSDFGKHIHYSLFGQAYSDYIGITIDGLPAGEYINPYHIQDFIARQAPGESKGFTVQRLEKDEIQILSGVVDNVTCGSPLCAVIPNPEYTPEEGDANLNLLRPSTGDYTAHLKYRGFEDLRGGGPFSVALPPPFASEVPSPKIFWKNAALLSVHISNPSASFRINPSTPSMSPPIN